MQTTATPPSPAEQPRDWISESANDITRGVIRALDVKDAGYGTAAFRSAKVSVDCALRAMHAQAHSRGIITGMRYRWHVAFLGLIVGYAAGWLMNGWPM